MTVERVRLASVLLGAIIGLTIGLGVVAWQIHTRNVDYSWAVGHLEARRGADESDCQRQHDDRSPLLADRTLHLGSWRDGCIAGAREEAARPDPPPCVTGCPGPPGSPGARS